MPAKKSNKRKKHNKIPAYAVQSRKSQNTEFVVNASPDTVRNLRKFLPSPIKSLVTAKRSSLSFFTSPNTGKQRCVDTAQDATNTYRQVLAASCEKKKIAIFMTNTPIANQEHASPTSIQIAPSSEERALDFCDYYSEIMCKPTRFSFEITRDSLVFDTRKYSQKNITHYTAQEFLAVFAEKLPLNKKYHLAHRHGHHLGGAGTIDNLDAGTAGSNFTTLCYIETIVHNLLTNGSAKIITVTGDVTYDAEYRCVVRHIDYCIFADGVKLFTKRIEHLEHRLPRIEEHHLAMGLAEFMISNAVKEHRQEVEEERTVENADETEFDIKPPTSP